jgi:hypothetical protein
MQVSVLYWLGYFLCFGHGKGENAADFSSQAMSRTALTHELTYPHWKFLRKYLNGYMKKYFAQKDPGWVS